MVGNHALLFQIIYARADGLAAYLRTPAGTIITSFGVYILIGPVLNWLKLDKLAAQFPS